MKRKIQIGYLFILLLFSIVLSAQNSKIKTQSLFPYKQLPTHLIHRISVNVAINDFVDATKYLPKKYDKTGKTDYTDYLQKALLENRKVCMPDFPVLINDKGLIIPSDTEFFFFKQSKILMLPSSNTHYTILNIHNKKNVKIYNPVIIGDRFEHKNSEGEWGMGISILSSSNIHVINPEISNCFGDGIEIGSSGINSSKDIIIKGGVLDFNRRNGLSVLDVDGLIIENLTISNTNGILPSVGLVIEPFRSTQEIINVHLKRIKTFNNNTGLALQLNEMFSKESKYVSFSIDGYEDYYSNDVPIYVGVWRKKVDNSLQNIQGLIQIKNIKISQTNTNYFLGLDNIKEGLPKVQVENFIINKKKNRGAIKFFNENKIINISNNKFIY